MANNRMFLVCRCGEVARIGKYYPSLGWQLDQKPLTDWFEKHENCSEFDHLFGPTHYRLAYETDANMYFEGGKFIFRIH